MSRLVKVIALFLSPIIVVILLIVGFPPAKNDKAYLACILDKDRIVDSGSNGRLIFIGGSNLAFGLNCDSLSGVYNQHVINYGIQGGLGVFFQLNHLKSKLRRGDTLIIIPEYDQYLGDNVRGTGQALAKMVSLLGIRELYNLDAKQIRKLTPFIINASIEKIKLYYNPNPDGERQYFNDKGDFIGHLNLDNRKPDVIERYYFHDSISNNTITALEGYQTYFNKRGVAVYFSFPPYPHSLYLKQFTIIDEIENRLKKSSLKLLGNTNNYIYADSLFFEYPLHLNRQGRRIRTENLLRDFKNKISS